MGITIFKYKLLYFVKISIIIFVCRHIVFSTFVFLIFSLHIFKKVIALGLQFSVIGFAGLLCNVSSEVGNFSLGIHLGLWKLPECELSWNTMF